MARAREEAGRGEYKDAYNTLGTALTIGGPADQEVRYLRGIYAYKVGHARLNAVEQAPELGQTLFKAACWLSRSEAMLRSVADAATVDDERRRIESDLGRTKHEQDRFRRLWHESAVRASAGSGCAD